MKISRLECESQPASPSGESRSNTTNQFGRFVMTTALLANLKLCIKMRAAYRIAIYFAGNRDAVLFLRNNSNSTLLVLNKVAKTSIRAISSSPVITLKSNSLKNIPNPRYNSAYARLTTSAIVTKGEEILDANTGSLPFGEWEEILFHGDIICPILPKPTIWCERMWIRKYCRIVMDYRCWGGDDGATWDISSLEIPTAMRGRCIYINK